MGIGLLPWLVPLLLAAEVGVVAYRRRDRYPRFLFNGWAPAIYLALVLADLLLALLLTILLGGGRADAVAQANSLLVWALFAALAAAVAAGLTLFFRWVLRGDMPDIPD